MYSWCQRQLLQLFTLTLLTTQAIWFHHIFLPNCFLTTWMTSAKPVKTHRSFRIAVSPSRVSIQLISLLKVFQSCLVLKVVFLFLFAFNFNIHSLDGLIFFLLNYKSPQKSDVLSRKTKTIKNLYFILFLERSSRLKILLPCSKAHPLELYTILQVCLKFLQLSADTLTTSRFQLWLDLISLYTRYLFQIAWASREGFQYIHLHVTRCPVLPSGLWKELFHFLSWGASFNIPSPNQLPLENHLFLVSLWRENSSFVTHNISTINPDGKILRLWAGYDLALLAISDVHQSSGLHCVVSKL